MNIQHPSETMVVLPFTTPRAYDAKRPQERRLTGLDWMGNTFRNHLIAMLGEFVGTFLFLFFAFGGTQIANGVVTDSGGPDISVLLYICLSFGFSLAVNAWVFFRISGGLFNPAVTLGMCLIGAVGWFRGALVVFAQILGAIASAGIVSCLFPGPLAVRTRLSENPRTSIVRGLFIEMFLTATLVFTIFMLAAEKHKGTFLAPIGIGLALFICELAGVRWTGGSLNPARSLGPDVINARFDGYHWIYWLGPVLGAILAVLFYRLVKVLEYETANPGQDLDHKPEVFYDEGVRQRSNPNSSGNDGTDERQYNVRPGSNPVDKLIQVQREPGTRHDEKSLGSASPANESLRRHGGAVSPAEASLDSTGRTFVRSSDAEKGKMPQGRYAA